MKAICKLWRVWLLSVLTLFFFLFPLLLNQTTSAQDIESTPSFVLSEPTPTPEISEDNFLQSKELNSEIQSLESQVDLEVIDIIVNQDPICADSTANFSALISNNGSQASGFFYILWDVDGQKLSGGHYSIPAGTTDSHGHLWENILVGQHTLSFTADYYNIIHESDENNNQLTKTFTVIDCSIGQKVVVPATAQWVNTEIDLDAGDQLLITSTGSWSPGPGFGTWGPDGSTQLWPDNFLNLTDIGACSVCATTPTSHFASLIGYIGNDPPLPGSYTTESIRSEAEKVFFVGSNFNGSALHSGTLWLNFNDAAYSNYTIDNSGQVTAQVQVNGPTAREPIIFLPGILGSEIKTNADFHLSIDDGHGGTFERDYSSGEVVWPSCEIVNNIQDDYFDVLKLESDGRTPVAPNLDVGNIVKDVECRSQKAEFYTKWSQPFTDLGYTQGTDIFEFPYDWRMDISETVNKLDDFINNVLISINGGEEDKSKWVVAKVNLISHSMGGTVVKAYINNETRANKVNQVIALAPAYLGAPKFLKAVLFGDNLDICYEDERLGINVKICFLNPNETKDLVQNMPGAFQVGPSRLYWEFYDGSSPGLLTPFKEDRDYDNDGVISGNLDYLETRAMLSRIGINMTPFDISASLHNNLDNSWDSGPPVPVSIVAGTGICTPGQLRVYNKVKFSLPWGNILKPAIDMLFVSGDDTVPQFSSTLYDSTRGIDHRGGNSGAQLYYAQGIGHNDIFKPDKSGAMQLAANILSGNSEIPGDISQDPKVSDCVGQEISVESPVELHVYDLSNRHTGPVSVNGSEYDVEESIPGSSYEELLDSKFIYLPDNGTYTIKLVATGEGDFTLRLRNYQNDQIEKTINYLNVPLTNSTNAEIFFNTTNPEPPMLNLDHDGDEVFDEIISPSSILDENESSDTQSPVIVVNRPEENTAYAGRIPVSWSISDDNSGVLNEYAVIDAGTSSAQTVENGEEIILKPGEHTLTVAAEDRFGNGSLEEVSFLVFQMDIKPGSDPNSVNCQNDKEVIFVAILTTDSFNALSVDHNSVSFEGAYETHKDKDGYVKRHEEDVDGDGDVDLVFHFRLGDTALTCDSVYGLLKGKTFDATAIEGRDNVRMVNTGK